jgi:L-type amino acid transporter 6
VPDDQSFSDLSDRQDAEISAQPLSSPSINDNSHLSLSDHNEQLTENETSFQAAKSSLTFTNGLALVIGLQIGSGIFSAPSQVSRHVVSAGSAVTVWFLGGLLVWTGAASFIELGLAIPRNGGVQEYLRHCYGDFLGFLFTCIWVAISKPSAMAMIAMVFSDHFCHVIFPATWSYPLLSKLVALLGLAFITFINCLGARTGAVAANGFLVLKLFAVFSIAFTGIGFAITGKSEGPSSSGHGWFGKDPQFDSWTIWVFVGNYVTALFGALFCYGGWETVCCHLSFTNSCSRNAQIGFVAGDMRDPARDLPRVINTAMAIVIIGFVLMDIALYVAVPIEAMRDNSTPAVVSSLYLSNIPFPKAYLPLTNSLGQQGICFQGTRRCWWVPLLIHDFGVCHGCLERQRLRHCKTLCRR